MTIVHDYSCLHIASLNGHFDGTEDLTRAGGASLLVYELAADNAHVARRFVEGGAVEQRGAGSLVATQQSLASSPFLVPSSPRRRRRTNGREGWPWRVQVLFVRTTIRCWRSP